MTELEKYLTKENEDLKQEIKSLREELELLRRAGQNLFVALATPRSRR